ncbi:hypothetical protein [Bosea massiliensis]|uniref:Uncharacterized protein n=1 Tax=Bosea massiliensis TaxID=151419 RepID=A0ABW0NYD6_9HYPH
MKDDDEDQPDKGDLKMAATRLPTLTRIGIKLSYRGEAALDYEACLEHKFAERIAKNGREEAEAWLKFETRSLYAGETARAIWWAIITWFKW